MSLPATRIGVVRDPVVRFVLTAGALFMAWYFLYEFVLHPDGRFDRWLIESLVALSGGLLELLGYELLPETGRDMGYRTVGVQGGYPLWIGDPCNGASVFAVFLIFLVAYRGVNKHLWWFAPLGLISIHLINVLRIVALVLVAKRNYELLTFNHDYTFQVIVYGWVFLLWYLWVKRSPKSPTPRVAS